MAGINVLKQDTARFHSRAAYKYLFIVDEVALDTGRVLVVFFDDCGQTVRQSRVEPQHCEEIAAAWFDFFIDEMDVFIEADIGVDYLPGWSCVFPYATQKQTARS